MRAIVKFKDGTREEHEALRIFSATPVDNLGIIRLKQRDCGTNIILGEYKKKDIEEIIFTEK